MSTAQDQPGVEQGLHPKRWTALGLLGTAQFMLILDVTVVAIALPQMGIDLSLSREAVTWVVAAYTLTFGGFMLLGGRSADLFGAKAIVYAGLSAFSIGSLVAGLAGNATMLLAGRIAQGLGAAMLSPAALSVVVRLFSGDERNRALGIWSALGGGGAAVGVLLGGLITAGPGWPWVFFINIPVGVIVLVGLLRVLPTLPALAESRGTLDILGALLVTAATGSAIYALTVAGEAGWASVTTLVAAGAAIVLYLLFAWRQKTARSPLMDLGLLGRRPVTAGVFVILIATALMVAIFFLGTFYFQQSAGHGPLVTGLLFLPIALATMTGANLGGRLIGRLGARALGAGGMVVAAIGLLVPALWTTTLATTIGVSFGAFGIGALFVVASATALGQVAHEEAGIASGLLSTFHEFGASIGVATVSSIAALSLSAGAGDAGFQQAFGAAAAAALVAAAVGFALIPARSAH
ncbi:EmrB/QacA subfamily drug resistance transporter [Pseudonocardia sediminis]|uniref:EmrB/QacA subfamily drug resistance transporter n=1 Tax=Pseudonocardia sediminis TaxID=1397368 RepID=A0A4Q7UXC2_PSEST|nr:MFS transporter [Pseudonocardia sediminis]RZT85581.1 EmrB/QacA subfamily drug resistance transporter [Pseudonocardia sediminis]